MSPRDAELLAAARTRLADARRMLDAGLLDPTVGVAYYASLYGARAALSSRDLWARTHAGTWHSFSEQFVKTGQVDAQLAGQAAGASQLRQSVDYEAVSVDRATVEELIVTAERFVAAVAEVLGPRT